MAKFAKRLVEAQGLDHVVEVIQGVIESVQLPEKVDIIISVRFEPFLCSFGTPAHIRINPLTCTGVVHAGMDGESSGSSTLCPAALLALIIGSFLATLVDVGTLFCAGILPAARVHAGQCASGARQVSEGWWRAVPISCPHVRRCPKSLVELRLVGVVLP